MVMNLTNLTNAETFYSVVQFDNQVTGGFMGFLFVISFFIIMLMVMLKNSTFAESLTVASAISFLVSLSLRVISLVDISIVITFGVIMALGGFWVYLENKT